jgi:predicted nucleotidyltransferase
MVIDIRAAARTYQQRRKREQAEVQERLRAMQASASTLIAHVRDAYRPVRIYQWGSLTDPRLFSTISDIDIAVEGIEQLETWLQLEKDLFEMTDYPLDLVRWEYLWPEHREQILRRGRVVYERPRED